jgi:hypothetical protein
MSLEQIKTKLSLSKIKQRLDFYKSTQKINENKKLVHYFSTKPKKNLILLSIGLIPYLNNDIKFNLINSYPFGFTLHTHNNEINEISISPILFNLLKNYNQGCKVKQNCIDEILNYID